MITGGQYDVDVELLSPTKEIIYKQIKSQFDSHQFNAPVKSLSAITISHTNKYFLMNRKRVFMLHVLAMNFQHFRISSYTWILAYRMIRILHFP